MLRTPPHFIIKTNTCQQYATIALIAHLMRRSVDKLVNAIKLALSLAFSLVFYTSVLIASTTEYITMGMLITISLIMYFISFLLCLSCRVLLKDKSPAEAEQLPPEPIRV